ncbi:MAG: ribokinase [Phycisphaeraceae bacterium]
MRTLNFGSLNIDEVYAVERIARPGETVASRSRGLFAGGKGANQSVALARAGATVAHAGAVGEDGRWLIDKLAADGVDTQHIRVGAAPTGRAVIQVDHAGQNAIVLLAGANHAITAEQREQTLAGFAAGDLLLVQNEINAVPELMRAAKARGMRVCFNPAPFTIEVRDYPLDLVDVLVVNESEGEGLTTEREPRTIASELAWRNLEQDVIVTCGSQGVLHQRGDVCLSVEAVRVAAVDTTAAGDCFIGYFLAGRAAGMDIEAALRRACRAAAISVTRPGAMDSIPCRAEVDDLA